MFKLNERISYFLILKVVIVIIFVTGICSDLCERVLIMDEEQEHQSPNELYDSRLKGTFLSVVLIGIFIMLSWAGVFVFYWKAL